MADAAKRNATYEDLLAVPDRFIAQILNGVLYTHPRPAAPHARAASRLGFKLGDPFDFGGGDRPGGWIILDEPELHLHGDVVVPDLAGWRRERMPKLPMEAAAFELAPDWACEVLSPSTTMIDRAEKMPIYAREQVPHVWIVDPLAKTHEAYELENARWVLLGTWHDDAKIRVKPFDAIELELEVLWAT